MSYPKWDESASDELLIAEFYVQLFIRYPQLRDNVEHNDGLLHIDMSVLQRLAEGLCKEGKSDELESCFTWINSLFCRSKNELLNAIKVSFLEYFDYQHSLSDEAFEKIMPRELFRGYTEIMAYMEKLALDSEKHNNK